MIDRIFGRSKDRGNESSEKTPWQEFLEETKKHPIGREYLVQKIINELNTHEASTQEVYYLYQAYLKNAGPVVTDKLKPLPRSIAEGTDDDYFAYEIRYNEIGSLDAQMGNTLLLCLFLCDLNDKTKCYLFGNDPDSKTNWETLLDRHQKLFDPE